MKFKKLFKKYISEIEWNNEVYYIFTLDGEIEYCPHGAVPCVVNKKDEWDFMFFKDVSLDFMKYDNVRSFIGMVSVDENRNEFLEKLKPFINKMRRLKVFNEDNLTEHILNIQIYKKNA